MYTIRAGDTLNRIAQKHRVSLGSLLSANPQIKNPDLILAGAKLNLPRDSFQASVPVAARQAPAASSAGLRRGVTGPSVREVQRKLVTLGYLSPEAMATGPGVFGPRTERAVKAFQGDHGIRQTGVVGQYTQAALDNARPAPRPAPLSPPAPSNTPTIPDLPATPAPAGYVPRHNGATPAPATRNTRAWEPVNAPLRSDPSDRSAARYADVINQFGVGVNPRYARRDGNTYCNIFVWDVTRAMGAEIPHWVAGRELNANSVNAWLHQTGPAAGWRKVDARTAQDFANRGRPAVASWRNPSGIGHVAMVRPGTVTSAGPASAQAGGRNFNFGHIANGFGSRQPEYWVHA
ncbi:MAG: peptidoglycan-binding protein [Myxococcaceae bacterium]